MSCLFFFQMGLFSLSTRGRSLQDYLRFTPHWITLAGQNTWYPSFRLQQCGKFPHILSATLRSTKMLKFIVSKPLESELQVKGKTQIMKNASLKRIKTETGKVSLGEVTLDCKRVKLILRATPLSRGPVYFTFWWRKVQFCILKFPREIWDWNK